jgi:arabinogalactan endo-1,4-beta-galactosidase
VEPLAFCHDHNGVTILRLRLWVDPYDENHRPYHGGTDDFAAFVKLARLGMSKGYAIMLDLQYSDFWCDPSKQTLPKAWKGLTFEGLLSEVYAYTLATLEEAQKEGVAIAYVQIGNEVTNGMLWPYGALTANPQGGVRCGYDSLCLLLGAGIKAARKAAPQAAVMLQLERSGNLPLHEEFFSEIAARGLDYDLIGLSYYPFWHGPFKDLWANVDNLAAKFQKPILIVETGYGFTLLPPPKGGNLIDAKFLADSPATAYTPYPLTKEGQKEFLEELLRGAEAHKVAAVVYWEPFWLPLRGLEWASKAGEAYLGDTSKPTHNEWANQCLFDYEGEATPGLEAFKV